MARVIFVLVVMTRCTGAWCAGLWAGGMTVGVAHHHAVFCLGYLLQNTLTIEIHNCVHLHSINGIEPIDWYHSTGDLVSKRMNAIEFMIIHESSTDKMCYSMPMCTLYPIAHPRRLQHSWMPNRMWRHHSTSQQHNLAGIAIAIQITMITWKQNAKRNPSKVIILRCKKHVPYLGILIP